VGSIQESGGNYVPTAGRSGQTQEISALIDAIFAEMLEIVAATYASIARTNAKAPRGRSYEPIAARFVRTQMRLELTAGICE
jgi:hypothetical protein